MEEFRLRSTTFRKERQTQWHALEMLVQKVEKKGYRSLSVDELHRLPSLYRAAVSGLSVARAISLDKNLLEYLESLVSRAYICVYGVKPRPRAVTVAFFKRIFPESVNRIRAEILVAFLVMGAGIAVGLSQGDMESYWSVMPDEMAQGRDPLSTTEELRDVLYGGKNFSEGELGFFATTLFTHNARVSILCFALGLALGLPTILLLFYNGLLIGTLASLYADRNLSIEFWAWLLPHGVTEILACTFAGGAGISLALALIRPGRHGRLHALKRAGREASMVVPGRCVHVGLGRVYRGILSAACAWSFRAIRSGLNVGSLLDRLFRSGPARRMDGVCEKYGFPSKG